MTPALPRNSSRKLPNHARAVMGFASRPGAHPRPMARHITAATGKAPATSTAKIQAAGVWGRPGSSPGLANEPPAYQ
jgi:hypothetical protein